MSAMQSFHCSNFSRISQNSQESGRMLVPLEESLIKRIMEIDEDDPYQSKETTSQTI
jgi:hypothetical protein